MRRVIGILAIFGIASLLAANPLPRLAPKPLPDDGLMPRVVMETNHGRIVIELYRDKAPLTVKNFLQYVDDRHYEGVIFHRVVPNFMIQAGGFTSGMKERPVRAPIKNEAANDLSNERGTVAAARTAQPDSATAQFYINTKDNKYLDRANTPDKVGWCVFGRVIEGMEVADRIGQVATNMQGAHANVPVQDVTILSIRRLAASQSR